MKLAIVGSVKLEGNRIAHAIIEGVLIRYKPDVVISGGAKGIDTMAELAAVRRQIRTLIYRPTVEAWGGPGGYQERNLKIAQACDALVRIAATNSPTYGSGWTRDRAVEMGKPTEEYVVPV